MKRVLILVMALCFMLVPLIGTSQTQQQDVLIQQEVIGPYPPWEYSNLSDERASLFPNYSHNGLDSGQNLFTVPPDDYGFPFPTDAFDYDNSEVNDPDYQVDAIANGRDAFFWYLREGAGVLLVSLVGDPNNAAAFYDNGGQTGVHCDQSELCYPDDPGSVDDVDGLELWGPRSGPDSCDANFFSLTDDYNTPTQTSVFYYDGTSATHYLGWLSIMNAVGSLGFEGSAVPDLDALMVWDVNEKGTWDSGDQILFSIRDTTPTNGNWDGGEIVLLSYPGGPATRFLSHYGRVWDTANDVSTHFGVVGTEDIDALEIHIRTVHRIPTLTRLGLLVVVLLLLVAGSLFIIRRRDSEAAVSK